MLVRHYLSLIFFLLGQGVAQQQEERALMSGRQSEVGVDSESGHSGTIYVVRHAETSKAKAPYGINEKGLRRARHLQQIFDGSKFEEPKSIIAGQVKGKRQRMQDTVTPLAEHLGIHIDTSVGPLVDDPHWTEAPCKDAAKKAKAALSKGPVLIGWWSYIEYLCKDLGASRCPGGASDFKGFDQVLVVKMKNGRVDSIEMDAEHFSQVDGQFEDDVVEEFNELEEEREEVV